MFVFGGNLNVARRKGATSVIALLNEEEEGGRNQDDTEEDKETGVDELEKEEQKLAARLEETRARLRKKMESSSEKRIYRALASEDLLPMAPTSVSVPALASTEYEERLPVISLPAPSRSAQIVNSLPRDPSDEELKRLEEEEEARIQAQIQLGLTREEIEAFDKNKESILLLPLSEREPQKKEQIGSKRCRRHKRPRKQQLTAEKSRLRIELEESVSKMKRFTKAVQSDLAALHKAYPGIGQQVKAQNFVQKWGLAKLEALFENRSFAKKSEALKRWKIFLKVLDMEQKQAAYLKLKGTARLSSLGARLQQKKLTAALWKWISIHRCEKELEGFVLKTESATRIQKVARGRQGRVRIERIRRRLEFQLQNAAASNIQRIYRGHKGKQRVAVLKETDILNHAALRLQANYRVRLAKFRAKRLKERYAAEKAAALRVQASWRRKKGEMAYHLLRQARRNHAATRVQCLQRRRMAKRKVSAMKIERKEFEASIKVQTLARSFIARKNMAKMKSEAATLRERQELVALRIQAIFRGRRGRLVLQLKRQAKLAKLREEEDKIKRIQAVARGRLGRLRARDRKKEYFREMCEWAKAWREVFDEEQEAYVFRNLYTNEIRIEPPGEGFIKRDGRLALLDGQEVDDPAIAERRECEKHLEKCCECEDFAASRKCNQCGDTFCDACFESIHIKGTLAQHTFEWFQEGQPELEAETDSEEDWIELFDEESGHPYWYSTLTGVATWQNPFHETGSAEYAVTNLVNADQVWQEFFDEDSGLPYFFNAKTFETTWETPW